MSGSDPQRLGLERLAALSPEGKARVESVLKTALEKELAAGAVAGPGGSAASFDKQAHDRGPLFGKDSFDKQSDSARHLEDMVTLARMGDAEFRNFRDRLTELRNIPARGGPGPGG